MCICLRSGHGVLCILDVTQSSRDTGGAGMDCGKMLTRSRIMLTFMVNTSFQGLENVKLK